MENQDNLLGVHCSVSGGLVNAFEEAAGLGINTFQIFSRNQRQWRTRPVDKDEKEAFRNAHNESRVQTTFSHCSYLINLAAEKDDIREKSIKALQGELERCTALGLSFCVLHPGAAGSQEKDIAIDKIAEALQIVLEATQGSPVKIALENTAGQGSSVGGPLENLKLITDRTGNPRIGFCIDTCHAFAAGYDIRTSEGFEAFMEIFSGMLGIKNLLALHLNDSKGSLGSHLDRHMHIGTGQLGIEPFRSIMNEYPHIPKVLETPKEDDWDKKNLELLRGLVE